MKFRFADCILDTDAHSLTRAGKVQRVEPQVFDLLHLLLRHPGVLITKDELIEAIWGGRIVSDSAISARIAMARKAVGDDGKGQRIIRTVARKGVQFVAEVEGTPPSPPVTGPSSPTPQNPTIRYATADDGVKIAFAVAGNGPPLLRFAYHPSHLELEWNHLTEKVFLQRLAKTNTLIRFDQRGSGLSELAVDDFSAARTAKDAAAVLEALGLDQVAILGESSGGNAAATFAAVYPERVVRMVSIGGYVDGRAIREGAGDDAILNMARTGWDTPGSAFITGFLSVYFPTATHEQLTAWAELQQNSAPVENEVAGRGFYNNHSTAPILGDVTAPTLIIHSRNDAVHPLTEAQKFARGVRNAELMILESRSHVPFPGDPGYETMMEAIEAFLSK